MAPVRAAATRRGAEVHLLARPRGWPALDDFAVVGVEVADPAEGEVLVRSSGDSS